MAVYNSFTLDAQVDYEVDLWGRVRDSVAAETAQAQRGLLEHSIAVLVGQSPSSFKLDTQTRLPELPAIPVGLPSTFFPALTLSGQGGFQSDAYGALLSAPNLYWAIGPTLFLNVFDGGKRKAEVAPRSRAISLPQILG